MIKVHHRYATVDGQRLFYREAGPAQAPAIVLLHGCPTSSYMFCNLIPQLAGDYRVIAPDLRQQLLPAPGQSVIAHGIDRRCCSEKRRLGRRLEHRLLGRPREGPDGRAVFANRSIGLYHQFEARR